MKKECFVCIALIVMISILVQGCSFNNQALTEYETAADAAILSADLASAGEDQIDSPTGNAYKVPLDRLKKLQYIDCLDSDEGRNYRVPGTASVAYTFGEEESRAEFTDECEDSVLIEHYCDGDRLMISEQECPDGCTRGMCLPSVGDICDTGEICVGRRVGYNYSCDAQGAEAEDGGHLCACNKYCKVIKVNAACDETDDGHDLETVGTVRRFSTKGVQDVYADFCIDKSTVREFVCEDGKISSEAVICPGGCKDGVCLPYVEVKEEPKPVVNITVKNEINLTEMEYERQCNDTEVGMDFTIPGKVYTSVEYLNKTQNITINDLCILADGYAEVIGKEGDDYEFRTIDECPYYLINRDSQLDIGECMVKSYRDVSGCTGEDCFVREVYCRHGKHKFVEYRCSYGCSEGACISLDAYNERQKAAAARIANMTNVTQSD